MANMTFGVNLIPHNNTPTGSNTYTLGNSSYKWKLYADELNGQPLANMTNLYYVEGPSSNTTGGTWTGTITGLSAYYDGLTVMYLPAVAGGASGTTLNLNSKGAITCYNANNNPIDDQYKAGTPVLLVYKNGKWLQSDNYALTDQDQDTIAQLVGSMDEELPATYKRVKGLTFNNNGYYAITNFKLQGSDTLRFKFSANTSCNVLGCYTDSSAQTNYSLYVATTSGSYLRYNGGAYNSAITAGETYNMVITPTGATGLASSSTWTAKTFTAASDFCIGTTSASAASSKLVGTLYGNIVVDGRAKFIPCERLSDHVLGYYNLNSSTFYAATGTAPTSIGYDISHTIQGKLIASTTLNNNYTLTITYTDGTSYTTGSIRGADGVTPAFSIGTVSSGTTAAASITGTSAAPVLNLTLPKGDDANIFIITATNSSQYVSSSYWTVDKTFTQIYEAYTAGKLLLVVLSRTHSSYRTSTIMTIDPMYGVGVSQAGFRGTYSIGGKTLLAKFIITSTNTYTFTDQYIGDVTPTNAIRNNHPTTEYALSMDDDGLWRLYTMSGDTMDYNTFTYYYLGQSNGPCYRYMLINIVDEYSNTTPFGQRMSTFKFEYGDTYLAYDEVLDDNVQRVRMVFSSMYMEDNDDTLYRRIMILDGTGDEDLDNDGVAAKFIDIDIQHPQNFIVGTVTTGAAGSNANVSISKVNSVIDFRNLVPAVTNDWAILFNLSDVALLPNTKYEYSITGDTAWSYALYIDDTKYADPIGRGQSVIITTPSTISGSYLKLVGDEGAGADPIGLIGAKLIAPSVIDFTIPRGDQGPQGDSYLITAQDKQDIADLLEDEFVDDTGWVDLSSDYIKPSLINSGSLKFRRIGSLIYILFGGTLKGTLNASAWLTVNQTSGGTTIPIPEEWRPNATIYIPGYSQTSGSCIRVTSAGMIAIRNQTGSTVKGVDSGGSWWINSHGCYFASNGMLSSGLTEIHLTGATQTVTAEANTRYICDTTITSLSFTPPSFGITDIIFTTGSTLPVTTFPSTVKFPEWFEVETEKIYEINILNGVYAVVGIWEA